MSSVRRWYLFAVCAVSIQSVAWAAIVLLRGLLNPRLQADFELISVQIAVIILAYQFFCGIGVERAIILWIKLWMEWSM